MGLKNIGIDLFMNIMEESRHNKTLLDSFSPNQFKSKLALINEIESLGILDKNSEIVIFGSWYGSILVPAFDYVKYISMVDIDSKVLSVAKNRLFKNHSNINYVNRDTFDWGNDAITMKTADLIINTSCEHMKPMFNLRLKKNTYFAFQSNNMFDIPTHINCVNNMDEFKRQLPEDSRVIKQHEIKDSRGTRYMLIGEICVE